MLATSMQRTENLNAEDVFEIIWYFLLDLLSDLDLDSNLNSKAYNRFIDCTVKILICFQMKSMMCWNVPNLISIHNTVVFMRIVGK